MSDIRVDTQAISDWRYCRADLDDAYLEVGVSADGRIRVLGWGWDGDQKTVVAMMSFAEFLRVVKQHESAHVSDPIQQSPTRSVVV